MQSSLDVVNWKKFGLISRDMIMKRLERRPTPFALSFLAILVVVLLGGGSAVAAPLGNPLDSLPTESNPVSGFAAPAGYGNLTGADGSVDSPAWRAVTDLGYLHGFTGFNTSPDFTIDTGISGLTGVAVTPNGLALSAGNDLYLGDILGNAWNQTGIISLDTVSDITDVDYALAHFFVATEGDGIRRVENTSGDTTGIAPGVGYSLNMIEFKPDTYDNPMAQFEGDMFRNVDFNGNPFGTGKLVDIHAGGDVQGVAYFFNENGTPLGWNAVIQEGVNLYNPLEYQQHMGDTGIIPEPGSIALIAAGLLALGAVTYMKRKEIFVIQYR